MIGVVGDWRSKLTAEQAAAIDERVKQHPDLLDFPIIDGTEQ